MFLQKSHNHAWEQQKSFVEIKPVPVVKDMEIWQFILATVV